MYLHETQFTEVSPLEQIGQGIWENVKEISEGRSSQGNKRAADYF